MICNSSSASTGLSYNINMLINLHHRQFISKHKVEDAQNEICEIKYHYNKTLPSWWDFPLQATSLVP